MQLKGLVRFFTILLIIYSLYQLSFTWFVRSHEKKMEARARSYVKTNFQNALEKYPNNKDSQAVYQEVVDKAYQDRLKRLLDSTKDVTITYGINGAMSYQKAKEEELNLGLDLQGGMNVMLEVEMSGLLKSLANNSKDTNFLAADCVIAYALVHSCMPATSNVSEYLRAYKFLITLWFHFSLPKK